MSIAARVVVTLCTCYSVSWVCMYGGGGGGNLLRYVVCRNQTFRNSSHTGCWALARLWNLGNQIQKHICSSAGLCGQFISEVNKTFPKCFDVKAIVFVQRKMVGNRCSGRFGPKTVFCALKITWKVYKTARRELACCTYGLNVQKLDFDTFFVLLC